MLVKLQKIKKLKFEKNFIITILILSKLQKYASALKKNRG